MIYQAGKRVIERLYFIKHIFLLATMKNFTENQISEVWPGPMEGVMKTAFIETVSKLELVSRWMTPFFRVSGYVPKKRYLMEFLTPFLNTGLPVSGQLMGTDAKLLGETAKMMLDAGCFEVNLNCGCPSNRVVSGNAGGGALKDLAKLADILKHLRDTLPDGRFSVKSRIGYDFPATREVLNTIIEYGKPDRLTIHCRTTKEAYIPVPDMQERFDEVIALTSPAREQGMVLILNGDISSVETARNLAQKANGCGIMSARPWMRDLALLRRMEDKPAADEESLKEEFFDTFSTLNSAQGASLEIARLLWGSDSDKFRSMLNGKR